MLVAVAVLRSPHQTHFYQPSARQIYQSLSSRRDATYPFSSRDNSIPWLSMDSTLLAHYTPPRGSSAISNAPSRRERRASESQTKHAYRTAAGRRVQQPWRLPPVASIRRPHQLLPRQPWTNPVVCTLPSPTSFLPPATLPRRHWPRQHRPMAI